MGISIVSNVSRGAATLLSSLDEMSPLRGLLELAVSFPRLTPWANEITPLAADTPISSQPVGWMSGNLLTARQRVRIDRIRGARVGLRRMALQLLQRDRDRPLELRVVAFADELRILLDLDVRRDAAVLDFPFSRQAVDRPARRGDAPPSISVG